jgi:hypothetical protein
MAELKKEERQNGERLNGRTENGRAAEQQNGSNSRLAEW